MSEPEPSQLGVFICGRDTGEIVEDDVIYRNNCDYDAKRHQRTRPLFLLSTQHCKAFSGSATTHTVSATPPPDTCGPQPPSTPAKTKLPANGGGNGDPYIVPLAHRSSVGGLPSAPESGLVKEVKEIFEE